MCHTHDREHRAATQHLLLSLVTHFSIGVLLHHLALATHLSDAVAPLGSRQYGRAMRILLMVWTTPFNELIRMPPTTTWLDQLIPWDWGWLAMLGNSVLWAIVVAVVRNRSTHTMSRGYRVMSPCTDRRVQRRYRLHFWGGLRILSLIAIWSISVLLREAFLIGCASALQSSQLDGRVRCSEMTELRMLFKIGYVPAV